MADITNALMILPNLVALLSLRKVIINETRKYFDKLERETVKLPKNAVVE